MSSRRLLTLRSLNVRSTSAFSARALPRPSVGGSATSSTAAAPDGSRWPPADPPRATGRGDECLFQAGCVEVGPSLCEQGRCARRQRCSRARAADRAVPGSPVLVTSRIGGRKADSRGAHLRLRRTVERESLGRERRSVADGTVRVEGAAPTRASPGHHAGPRREPWRPRPADRPRIRISIGPSVPRAPAGNGPSMRIAGAPAATISRTASGTTSPAAARRCACDPAEAPLVEEPRQAARRTDDDRGGTRSATTGAETERSGATTPPRG